ncbi:MAG: Abi family protein [Pseudomonadota bacterium]
MNKATDPAYVIALEQSLSRERLDKYLQAEGGDLEKALRLYEKNTSLSEAFYTPLQTMEVCLRNQLHNRMTLKYGAAWFNQPAWLDADSLEKIQQARADLSFARKPVTPGGIVAELNFGFWVGLLGPRYDATLWRRALYRSFIHQGRPIKRTRVHGRFNALRRFRNRIAHHEPIFNRDLKVMHNEIIEAIGWMCPDTAQWAAAQSRVSSACFHKAPLHEAHPIFVLRVWNGGPPHDSQPLADTPPAQPPV